MTAVIADDLSGALEVGAAFYDAGADVSLSFDSCCTHQATIAVLDTESRAAPPSEAAGRMQKALNAVQAAGRRCLYKKVDSTLRGHFRDELDVCRNALNDTLIIVNPANPGAGRTVRGGKLFVGDTPVEESSFRHDPVMPVSQSRIADVIGLPVLEAGIDVVQSEELPEVMTEAKDTRRLLVPDALSDDDLARIVNTALAVTDDVLFVGSGGMATHVAATIVQPAQDRTAPKLSDGLKLFVCGSAHEVNREQAARLMHAEGVPVAVIDCLLIEDPDYPQELADKMPETGGAVVMKNEFLSDDVSKAFTAMLSEFVCQVRQRKTIASLFLTGGETAYTVLAALGARSLRLVGQVEPGVAVAEMQNGPLVVTKPGGFGDADTMARIWNYLRSKTQ